MLLEDVQGDTWNSPEEHWRHRLQTVSVVAEQGDSVVCVTGQMLQALQILFEVSVGATIWYCIPGVQTVRFVQTLSDVAVGLVLWNVEAGQDGVILVHTRSEVRVGGLDSNSAEVHVV